jgi:hypothetical protein
VAGIESITGIHIEHNGEQKRVMPQQHIPSGQDWDAVNVGRSGTGGLKAVPKTAQELSLAKAKGLVTTEKRHGAGSNQSAHSGGVLSARKLEEADDVGTIVKVDKSLSKAIMQVSFGYFLCIRDLLYFSTSFLMPFFH